MIITEEAGVGGNCVCQENVSGRHIFPRKFCPTGQDILSTLGHIVHQTPWDQENLSYYRGSA